MNILSLCGPSNKPQFGPREVNPGESMNLWGLFTGPALEFDGV